VDQGNLLLPSKELRVVGQEGKMGDSIAHVVRCYPVMRKRMSLEVYIPTMRIDGWRDSLKEFKLV